MQKEKKNETTSRKKKSPHPLPCLPRHHRRVKLDQNRRLDLALLPTLLLLLLPFRGRKLATAFSSTATSASASSAAASTLHGDKVRGDPRREPRRRQRAADDARGESRAVEPPEVPRHGHEPQRRQVEVRDHKLVVGGVALLEVARGAPEQRAPERRVRELEGLERRRGPLPGALSPAEELEQGDADAVAQVFEPENEVFFFLLLFVEVEGGES